MPDKPPRVPDEPKLKDKPKFWNYTILLGAAIGALAADVALNIAFRGVGEAIKVIGGGGVFATMAGAVVAGVLISNQMSKNRVQQEYKRAREYMAQHRGKYRGRVVEEVLGRQPLVPPRSYTVTPEEARLLEVGLHKHSEEHASHIAHEHDTPQLPSH